MKKQKWILLLPCDRWPVRAYVMYKLRLMWRFYFVSIFFTVAVFLSFSITSHTRLAFHKRRFVCVSLAAWHDGVCTSLCSNKRSSTSDKCQYLAFVIEILLLFYKYVYMHTKCCLLNTFSIQFFFTSSFFFFYFRSPSSSHLDLEAVIISRSNVNKLWTFKHSLRIYIYVIVGCRCAPYRLLHLYLVCVCVNVCTMHVWRRGVKKNTGIKQVTNQKWEKYSRWTEMWKEEDIHKLKCFDEGIARS